MNKNYKRVYAYKVTLACDKCSGGEMEATGYCLTSYPPQYPHKCNKCDAMVNVSGETFPKIEYKDHEVNNPENEPF